MCPCAQYKIKTAKKKKESWESHEHLHRGCGLFKWFFRAFFFFLSRGVTLFLSITHPLPYILAARRRRGVKQQERRPFFSLYIYSRVPMRESRAQVPLCVSVMLLDIRTYVSPHPLQQVPLFPQRRLISRSHSHSNPCQFHLLSPRERLARLMYIHALYYYIVPVISSLEKQTWGGNSMRERKGFSLSISLFHFALCGVCIYNIVYISGFSWANSTSFAYTYIDTFDECTRGKKNFWIEKIRQSIHI